MASQGASTLAAHGVTLVSHCGASDLILLERLLDLLQVGQETDIGGNLVDGGTERGHGHQDIDINLARVGLASDGVVLLESGKLGNALIQILNLLVIALKESQEGTLGTGGAFDTAETEVFASAGQVAQVPEKLLNPEGGALADSGELSGLEVSESESGQVLVLLSKGAQALDDTGQLGQEDIETIAEDHQVSVVSDIARSGAQVDDGGSLGANNTKGVDVSHDIVATLLLLSVGQLVVDIVL